MSRTLDPATINALERTNGAYFIPTLFEISHEDLASSIYVVNHYSALTYLGQVYTPVEVEYTPPELNDDGSVSNASITITAINQQFTAILRSLTTPATINAQIMFWPISGTAEVIDSKTMKLRNCTGNIKYITGELEFDTRLKNRVPGRVVRPKNYRGAN